MSLTGDSDNEQGNAGDSPIPEDAPLESGDASYRPLRGWASTYNAEPTFWEKFSAGFGKLFAKKAPSDADQVADVARELESEQPESDSSTSGDNDETDSAVGLPVASSSDAPQALPEPPIVRDYTLRGGDDAVDMPVVRDYQLHSPEELETTAPAIPDGLVRETPEPKPGFLSRLFGGARKEADQPVAEPDHPDAPVAQDRLDRPSLEFFLRVDRAGESSADEQPGIEDALPMHIEPVAADAASADANVHNANDDGAAAAADPAPEKPGFFARLFSRKPKEEQEPVDLQHDLDANDAFDAAFDSFEAASEAQFEVSPSRFESVDEALPLDEPEVTPWAPTREVAALKMPADEAPKDDSRFAPPPAPSEDIAQASDSNSATIEIEPIVLPVAKADPAPEITGARTIEMEPVVLPPAVSAKAPVVGGFDVTLDPDTPQDSGASATPAALEDEDTDTRSMVQPTPATVTAAQEAQRGPFFVPKFRSFYNEIVSHKHQKAEFTAGFATAVMDYSADLSPDAAAAAVSKRLQEILELQAAEATWMGGEAAARYPDAQYAMAALADELFTHLDWPGRDGWPRHLVEQKLFRSNARDVEFFKRVDRLLKNEAVNPSPAAKDLARMYLLVLAAGFQGKYRPFGLTRPLAEYRRRLYEFVSQKDALLLYGTERKLFPQAAEQVVEGRAVSRFSMLQQWAAVLVILLIGYALISQLAWSRVSADLRDVTARVEAANSTSTSDGLAGDPR